MHTVHQLKARSSDGFLTKCGSLIPLSRPSEVTSWSSDVTCADCLPLQTAREVAVEPDSITGGFAEFSQPTLTEEAGGTQ